MTKQLIVVELPEDAGDEDFKKVRTMLKEIAAKRTGLNYDFILKTHNLKFKTTDQFISELTELLEKLRKR